MSWLFGNAPLATDQPEALVFRSTFVFVYFCDPVICPYISVADANWL